MVSVLDRFVDYIERDREYCWPGLGLYPDDDLIGPEARELSRLAEEVLETGDTVQERIERGNTVFGTARFYPDGEGEVEFNYVRESKLSENTLVEGKYRPGEDGFLSFL